MVMKDREEMTATEEVIKKNEKKKKAERLRVDALTRALKVYMATDWENTIDKKYTEEVEHYYEEEREYDEEQCGYYYQDDIEERNRNIRKQLYLRSQPAKTLRHNRLEKEIQLRRKQREEQATEVQITNLRDDTTAKAKEQGRQEEEGDHETEPHYWMDPRMVGATNATRRNGRTRTATREQPSEMAYTQSSVLRNKETASTHQSISYLNAFPRCDPSISGRPCCRFQGKSHEIVAFPGSEPF
jgi:recombination DNA repair RAD52 pathway protein